MTPIVVQFTLSWGFQVTFHFLQLLLFIFFIIFILFYLFICLFIYSFIYLFIYLFIYFQSSLSPFRIAELVTTNCIFYIFVR